jgi:hypothetical protein
MYERVIIPGTDEKYSNELNQIALQYSSKVKDATSYIAEAKALHDELEVFYISSMDFNKIENIQSEISAEISNLA